MDSIRADVALVSRGLASSRERAQSLIRAGLVKLNGAALEKPSVKVSESDILAVAGSDCPYVSRGGLKLEKALDAFSVSPDGQICMDVGASTGGFTDVLLRRGAELVYAIDVGTGQLVPEIAENPRVVSMEHTNARAGTRNVRSGSDARGNGRVIYFNQADFAGAQARHGRGRATGCSDQAAV